MKISKGYKEGNGVGISTSSIYSWCVSHMSTSVLVGQLMSEFPNVVNFFEYVRDTYILRIAI